MNVTSLDAEIIRIVVTDSGLGGISVLGELESKLKTARVFNNVELIYFNALYSKDLVYNEIESNREKANIFNNALFSMQDNYHPDIILIACNTLSVIYPITQFSNESKIRVEGIVEAGVDLFLNELKNNEESYVILFGTPTTINSQLHKTQLTKNGIDEHRIINQSCLLLESEIQDDPSSGMVISLINEFVDKASKKIIHKNEKIYAGLCCTHYGYSSDIFEKTLKSKFGRNIEILNPNSRMVTSLTADRSEKYNNTTVSVEVVSQVEIYEHEKLALSKILGNSSPLTVAAIENYILKTNLFEK